MIENQTLGQKIRKIRVVKKLTLANLSERCGISPSFLSQIERNQANPSVATLYALANELGVTPLDLIESEGYQNDRNSERTKTNVNIVRKEQRKVLFYPESEVRNELLTPDLKRAIQMMWVVIPKGEDSGDSPFEYEGEECSFVVEGKLETWIDGQRFELGPGDAVYHDNSVPFQSRNCGDSNLIMVVAKTPPSF